MAREIMKRFIAVTAVLVGGVAYAQPIQGPLEAQNSLAEITANGTQATARSNISAAASGANSDITSLTGLTTPLGGAYGGTGINNGSKTITLGGSLATSGANPLTFTTTGTTSVTLPTSGTLFSSASSIPYTNLPALSANQVLGSLTATTPSGLSVPACTGANAALQWGAGAGFGCVTISSGTNAPGGANTNVQYNNSTAFGGNSSFTYNGSGSIGLGTSGSTTGNIAFANGTSGVVNLTVPTGALGTVTDYLPLGGTLLTLGTANNTYATLGANSNITSLTGLTTPLSSSQGGSGVNNGSTTETRAGNVTFSGAYPVTLTATGSTGVTLPTTGTLLNNVASSVNTVVGAASSTTRTDLSVPSCSGSSNALQWTSGTGFGCGSITGTAATPGGSTGQVQYNNAGAFAAAPGFTFDGSSAIGLGVAGSTVGKAVFSNATSGSITLQAPTGALGSVTDTLPDGGTLLTTTGSGASLTGVAFSGANSNITSLSGLTTALSPSQGGTGINNGSKTVTLAGNLATSGANSLTLTTTGTTNVTMPTSGTLLNTVGNSSSTTVEPSDATTAVSLANFFDETKNVYSYGATGNGVSNDLAAGNAAAAAASSSGQVVYYPPGSYNFGGSTGNTETNDPLNLLIGASFPNGAPFGCTTQLFNNPSFDLCQAMNVQTGNQFMQDDTGILQPTAATNPAYEKNVFSAFMQQNDSSPDWASGDTHDGVAVFGDATMGASVALGREWGANFVANSTMSGADGLLTGIEVDIEPGIAQTALNSPTSKVGYTVFNLGSAEATAGMIIGANTSGGPTNGFYNGLVFQSSNDFGGDAWGLYNTGGNWPAWVDNAGSEGVNALIIGGTPPSGATPSFPSQTNGTLSVTSSTTGAIATFTDTAANGATIAITGNGGTTPHKFLAVGSGNLYINNSADSGHILTLTDAGTLTVPADMQSAGFALTNLMNYTTIPTIASGFGTSPSISNANGTAAFVLTVGSSPNDTGTITMPAAAHGWACDAQDESTVNSTVFMTREVGNSTTSVTFDQFNSSGVVQNWAAGDLLVIKCTAF